MEHKRAREEEDEAQAPPQQRRRAQGSEELSAREILELVERAPAVEELDSASLRRSVLALERRVTRNQEARMMHASEPEKFMESEVELDEEIKRLRVLAAAPALLGEFAALGAARTVTALLGHENADIAIDTVLLLQDLLGVETETPAEAQGLTALVDALVEAGALPAITGALGRLAAQAVEVAKDRTDAEAGQAESAAMFAAMAVLESVVEARPALCETLGEQAKLVEFLLARVRDHETPFDAVRGYAAELLSVLMQNSPANRERVGTADGMNCMLEGIATYRKTDPPTPDEREFVENLFDCVCSALLLPANKKRFDEADGIGLLLLLLKEKKFCRRGALRVLDFHLQSNPASCLLFVEALGLKTLFAAFMKKDSAKSKTKPSDEREDDEHTISCIVSLLKGTSQSQEAFARVLSKFSENDYEKVERLLEFHEKYSRLVAERDMSAAKKRAEMLRRGIDPTAEEGYAAQEFLDRLDAGLFVLQSVCLAMALAAKGDHGVRERVVRLLKLRDVEVQRVRDVLREYAESLGGEDDPERAARDRELVLGALEALV